ncbi:hypothetical protein GcM1_243125 [Golovinomyces cichoracearum]|uniref:Uncharacterized protein n=1 Tax=Golovinomyces cichoracearum TaxID=62708 RepID=A0A420IGI8_9PEZI|nr:hypothetical protein GcM1_243125 [Golovinomyces cichoracearum]
MASMNGVLSPPPIIDTVTSSMNLSSKRKREDNVLDSESVAPPQMSLAESQALIIDLIDILKADDPTPSILTRSIPDLPRSSGHDPKRPKAGEASISQTTILYRISSDYYQSVDEVLNDIDAAVNEITDKLELSNAVIQNQCTAISRPPSELSIKMTAFSQRARDIVRRGRASWERCRMSVKNGTSHNYPRIPAHEDYSQPKSSSLVNRLALTVYGNAPMPKQLFSSLQHPTKVNGSNEEVIVPIREVGLPNGIATTRIITMHPPSLTDGKKRPPTMGEIFPTPPNVTPSIPPKPSTIATTKSSTVGWYHPSSITSASKSLSYFNQAISSGQWIDYGKSNSSGRADKIKNRDRTLDLGISKNLSIESEAERLENLFRSAYSSFAPTKDNAAAIAPTGCLERMWWRELGESYFNCLVHNFKDTIEKEATESPSEEEINNDLEKFERTLKELENDAIDPNLDAPPCKTERSILEKEIDEVLKEISELLETLTSYQRIRHSSLSTLNRSTGIYSSPDLNSLGTPSKPNESELATYEILKSQLALMIASLPPYAVAKINSDRLEELSISTKIEVPLNDYKGVMEEDESSLRTTKMAIAVNTSLSSPRASTQSIHRGSTGNINPISHYGNQFNSSQSRGSTAQYYNSVQTPIRTPASGIQRSPSTVPVPYQTQRASSSGLYRPGTYGMSSYSHQATRSIQQPYPSSGQHVSYSPITTTQGNLNSPGQGYPHQRGTQSISQSVISSRFSSQSAYQAQAVSPSNNVEYNRHSNNYQIQRQSSPQKAMYSSQLQANQTTPISSVAQNSQPYTSNSTSQSSLVNGSSSQPSQTSYTQQATALGTLGNTQGFSTFMSDEQQQTLIQRQHASISSQQKVTMDNAKNVVQSSRIESPSKNTNVSNAVPATY